MKIAAFLMMMATAMPCGATSPVLDYLDLDADFPSGCGCSVMDAKEHFLISVKDMDYTTLDGKVTHHPAIIKLAGKRYELKWISSTEKPGRPYRGERFTKIYSDGTVRLVLNYRTTFVCPPKDESCEVIRYAVDAILTNEGQVYRLTGLKGDCGC